MKRPRDSQKRKKKKKKNLSQTKTRIKRALRRIEEGKDGSGEKDPREESGKNVPIGVRGGAEQQTKETTWWVGIGLLGGGEAAWTHSKSR